MRNKKYGYDLKFLPAARLAELLTTLPAQALISANQVGNLCVLVPVPGDAETLMQTAYIDFAREGTIEWDADPAAM